MQRYEKPWPNPKAVRLSTVATAAVKLNNNDSAYMCCIDENAIAEEWIFAIKDSVSKFGRIAINTKTWDGTDEVYGCCWNSRSKSDMDAMLSFKL